MNTIVRWFVKITAFPVHLFAFRTRVYYEDKAAQGKRIKGAAILVSNHTSVYDFAVYMFVFLFRKIRCIMAEVLFKKRFLGWFLRRLGGICVDRDRCDKSVICEAEQTLSRGGVVEIFPEGRLPKEGEQTPLPFKTGAVALALSTGAPIIPLFTNGSYSKSERARIIIGKKIYLSDHYRDDLTERENVALLSEMLRQKIIELGELLDEKTRQKGKTV